MWRVNLAVTFGMGTTVADRDEAIERVKRILLDVLRQHNIATTDAGDALFLVEINQAVAERL